MLTSTVGPVSADRSYIRTPLGQDPAGPCNHPEQPVHRSRERPKTCIPLRQRCQQWSGMPLHRRIILNRGFPGPTEDYLTPRGLSLSGELYISDSPAVFLPSLMMGKDADVQQHNGESTRVDVTWTLRNVRKVGGGYGQSTRYRGGISSGVLCPGGVHRSYYF